MVFFAAYLQIAYLVLVLYDFGKDLFEIPLSLKFLHFQHFLILLIRTNEFLIFVLIGLELVGKIGILLSFFFKIKKDVLIGGEFVDRSGYFSEEGMSRKYPLIGSDLFFY